MIGSKFKVSVAIIAALFYPGLISFFSLLQQQTALSYPKAKASIEFPPAPNRGGPDSTIGAGRRLIEDLPQEDFQNLLRLRGPCIENGTPLTALTPKNTGYNVGTTVVPNPTFFIYVPKTARQKAVFVVIDEEKNEVYRTTYTLTDNPGIVKLNLPETISLEIGKDYLWEFAVICTPEDRARDEYVQGKIKRTELREDLKTKLDREQAILEKAKLYAEAGIWHETLSAVAQLRSGNPAVWEDLLESVGLEDISREPFVDCCTVEN